MNIETFTKFFKNKIKYFLVFFIIFYFIAPNLLAAKTESQCKAERNGMYKTLNDSRKAGTITTEAYLDGIRVADNQLSICIKNADPEPEEQNNSVYPTASECQTAYLAASKDLGSKKELTPEEKQEYALKNAKFRDDCKKGLIPKGNKEYTTREALIGADSNNGGNSTDNTSIILEELPGLTDKDLIDHFKNSGEEGFVYYIKWIIRISIALGTIIAVSTLVFGGFLYITTDNYLKKSSGKKLIENALTGLLLLLTSYVILGQINSDLLKVHLNLKKINVTATGDELLEWSTEEYDTTIVGGKIVGNQLRLKGYRSTGKCYSTVVKNVPWYSFKFEPREPLGSDKRLCRVEAGSISKEKGEKNFAICVVESLGFWDKVLTWINVPKGNKICVYTK